MNKITINGKEYATRGGSVVVAGNRVIVDGKDVGGEPLSGIVEVWWDGPLASLKCDASVTCGEVLGSVRAGGSVRCANVGGDVDAGGSVNCGTVGGSVDAGGSVIVENAGKR